MTISDAELLRASAAGDSAAFGRLVERYQSLVCAVALSATGDPSRGEDIAQEAFMTAWRRLGQLREPDRFASWVCGIARNLARYHRRHQRRHAPAATETIDTAAALADAGPSPLDAAIARQRQDLVWEALRQIPETYREPLVLHYRDDRPLAEVASQLGLTTDAVKQRLCRGRRYLRKGLQELVAASLRALPRRDLGAAVVAAIAVSRIAVGSASAANLSAGAAKLGLGKALGALGAGAAGMAAVALAVVATLPAMQAPPAPAIAAPAPSVLAATPVVPAARPATPAPTPSANIAAPPAAPRPPRSRVPTARAPRGVVEMGVGQARRIDRLSAASGADAPARSPGAPNVLATEATAIHGGPSVSMRDVLDADAVHTADSHRPDSVQVADASRPDPEHTADAIALPIAPPDLRDRILRTADL